MGLDPGISPTGLHADTPNRSSATFDVLEAIRGDVDRLMLAMLLGRRFRRRDFAPMPDGRVRLTAPLARELAETVLPVARQAVAPVAEELARALGTARGTRSQIPSLPTNLSGDARSRGRDGIRRGERKTPSSSKSAVRSLVPAACLSCGVVLDDRKRTYCDECLARSNAEALAAASDRATEKLARRRAEGTDPAHGGEAGRRRGERVSRQLTESLRHDREHGPARSREAFTKEILPRLALVSTRAMAAATGLSHPYCSMIKRALYVPHARHWEALRRLADDSPEVEQPSTTA